MSTNTQKALLNKDVLELVDAGYLSESLKITDCGRDYLTHLMFVEYMPELVKRAKEKNAEAKAKCEPVA